MITTVAIGIVSAVFIVSVGLAFGRYLRRNRHRYPLPLDPPEQGKEFFDRARLTRPRPPSSEPIPVSETEEGKLWLEIASLTCPHCKDHPATWLAGPTGGMSQNIQCDHCGWWFNVTPAIGIAEDIGDKGGREKRNPDWRH